jgi:hypothetical protein
MILEGNFKVLQHLKISRLNILRVDHLEAMARNKKAALKRAAFNLDSYRDWVISGTNFEQIYSRFEGFF